MLEAGDWRLEASVPNSQFSMLNSRFVPASELSIEALADLYTRMFDDYFYPEPLQ